MIEAVYVGSEERREAITLYSSIERLRELGVIKAPKLDIDSITSAIERNVGIAVPDEPVPAVDITAYLDDIMNSIKGIQERKAQSVG